jgi:hypothetical protein
LTEIHENRCSVQILTGEDWNVVMYDGIQAYGGIKVRKGTENTNFYFHITTPYPIITLDTVTVSIRDWKKKICWISEKYNHTADNLLVATFYRIVLTLSTEC